MRSVSPANVVLHLKMAVFWVVAPCSQVEVYRRFRGACSLHLHVIALITETASASGTSVNVHQSTRRYNPDDSHLYSRRRENLKSHLHLIMLLSGYEYKLWSFWICGSRFLHAPVASVLLSLNVLKIFSYVQCKKLRHFIVYFRRLQTWTVLSCDLYAVL
jgi:hypothetical protein